MKVDNTQDCDTFNVEERMSATAKGLIFIGTQTWFREQQSTEIYQEFLSYLPQEDQEYWRNRAFLASSKLPASMYENMHIAFMRLWGKDGAQIFRDVAGKVAFRDLGSVLKILMKLGTPTYIASRFPTAYNRYFDQGTFRIVPPRNGANLSAVLEDAKAYGVSVCDGCIGWTHQALTYAGAKDLRVEHSICAFKGHPLCEYNYFWS